MRSVTQKDIGLALNLAKSTVSVALNPKLADRLPPETVSKIKAKAAEMGYRPIKQAAILSSGRSHTIGVAYRTRAYLHAPQERIRMIAQQTLKANYRLIGCDLDWFDPTTTAAQEYLMDSAVEGIVFCDLKESDQARWKDFLEKRSLPAVALGFGGGLEIDTAEADIETALREMTQHHLQLGSRRLAFLYGFRDPKAKIGAERIKRRSRGFIEAIKSVGGSLALHPNTAEFLGVEPFSARVKGGIGAEIFYPQWQEGFDNAFDVGQAVVKSMVKRDCLPDSLVCSSDAIAMGALSILLEEGIPVPGRVKLSGVDDSALSRYCGVPFTTIAQPSLEMANWSIQRLVERIEKPLALTKPEIAKFPCELVIRRSTAAEAQLQPPFNFEPELFHP